MIESRRQSREISPEESRELEVLVFDMVRERLLQAVGAGGMWTLAFRSSADTDSLFGETMAEYIARDIASQLAPPVAPASEVLGDVSLAEVDEPEDQADMPIEEPVELLVHSEIAAEVQADVDVDSRDEDKHYERRLVA